MKFTKAFTFEAAHHLPNVPVDHPCHRVHGHSHRVELTLEGPGDPRTDLVVDFFDVKTAFSPLQRQLDHFCLNDVAGLENPTAENISVWIWERVKPMLPLLAGVVVFETASRWVEYNG